MNKTAFLLVLIISLLVLSCKDSVIEPEQNGSSVISEQNESLKIAKRLIYEQDSIIRLYILADSTKQYKNSGSGFYYTLNCDCSSKTFKKGDNVQLLINVYGLDGELLYEGKKESFTVEQSGGELVAYHLIAKNLCKACKGEFIMPSSLAYGLVGDGDKVGANKVLIFKVSSL